MQQLKHLFIHRYIHTYIHTYIYFYEGGEVYVGDAELREGSSQENSLHDLQTAIQVASSGSLA